MAFSTKSLTALQFCGAAAVAVGLNLVATNAQALVLNGTSGTFANAIDGTNVTYPGSTVRWGTNIGNGQSGLGFDGVGSLNPVPIDTSFLVGTLAHFNNAIAGGSAASSVDLGINIDIASIGVTTFNFTFDIDETPNSGTCVYVSVTPCADSITWANAFAPQSFSDGGIDYTLQLLGFNNGGGLVNQFISQEGGTSRAGLYAQITQVPTQDVPTPAAILPALMGMFGAASRKKNQEKEVDQEV
jgi:hypothetical protein